MLSSRSPWVLFSLLTFSSPVLADASSEFPVDVTILETVNLPWQAPEVIVTSKAALDDLRVELSIDGARSTTQAAVDVDAGTTRTLGFLAGIGAHSCVVHVTVKRGAEELSRDFPAKVNVVAPLEVSFKPADVDLAARKLKLTAKSDVSFVELSIFDMDGQLVHQASTRIDDDVPGKAISLTWPQLSAAAARLALRVFSTTDTWTDVEWTPIQIEIPHEPIYFDEAVALADHPAKLAATYDAVRVALRHYADVPGLKLYVLGLTEEHAKLADAAARAKSVADYLSTRGGLRLPILAAGSDEAAADGPAQRGFVQAILAVDAPTRSEWAVVGHTRKAR